MSDEPEISIVVRTFNEARHLPVLLERLARQSRQDFEVIIVDSGSVDGTLEIARAAAVRLLRIDREHFTFGYSLNVGIRGARGSVVVIVSAHVRPAGADWLANLVAPLAEQDVSMVYGRQTGGPESKFSEAQDFRRTFGADRRDLAPPEFFANNANSAIRRQLWEVYPFDVDLPGLEDVDWARKWTRDGYRVVYEPSAMVHHIHEETWRQVRHRYYREAVAARQLGLRSRFGAVATAGREAFAALADLWQAPPRAARDILTFRFNKSLGAMRGLLDGAALRDREQRTSLVFESSFPAVVIEGPQRARLMRVDMPEVRPGDVVIKVAYVAVCGTDLEIYHGSLGYFANGLGKYPIVPGHEMSGTVVGFGTAVRELAVGDRVVVECIQSCGTCAQCARENWIGCAERKELGVLRANGAYARYVVVPARFVHKLPAEVELARAALCEPLAVCLKGVDRLSRSWGGDGRPRRCAVIGAGPLGRMCALVLAHRGHSVTAFDRDPKRLADLPELGIAVSDRLTGLEAFEGIVEATGDPSALEPILRDSAAGSVILLLGLPYARQEFSFETVVAYDKIVVGSVGSSSADFRRAIELLPKLPLDAYVRTVLPLERFAEAWRLFRSHECLKALLKVE